ncbi:MULTISPECIES: erythromycin esterase family protein [unclassified Microbacterium]|uniref:erythromycin esterase family protein n=1 Tax=unclassified Microbacterium TaxID=2609290 RepID=UPI00301A8265
MHETDRTHVLPLAAPGEPWDPALVRELVGDARIVLLGEGAHGVDDFARLADGLFRTLASDLGFTAFVRESGFAEGIEVDDWIQGGPGEVGDIARAGLTYGFGESEAVRRQLTWMRAENARGRSPLRFWGMDLPGSATSPGSAVRLCLARIPAEAGDDELRRITDLGGRTEAAIAWETRDEAAREQIRAGIRGLLDRVERHGDDLARRSAETLRAFLAELSWSGGEGPYPRESLMAGTVNWIAEREERILVLAHNAHVRREPLHGRPSLGSLLQERWGSDLRVIGMTSGRGPVVSFAERSPRPFDWEATLAEREPVPGSLEHALDPLGDAVVDLRRAPAALLAGVVGTLAGTGLDPLADAATAFDAIAHLRRASLVEGRLERLRAEFGAPAAAGAPPLARTGATVETVAGIAVADPYRWLEGDAAADPEVGAWQRAQAAYAEETIWAGRDRDAVRALIERSHAGARPELPVGAGGRWFRAEGRRIVVADEPYGPGRALVDLAEFDGPGRTAVLSWFAPSPDGTVLAVGVCTDGSEHNRVELVDVRSATRRDDAPPELLHSAWGGGISWRPDSGGFSFLGLSGPAHDFHQVVYRRDLGVRGPSELEHVPLPEGSREYTRIQFSPDGRWAVASHRVGTPFPVAVRDLHDPSGGWRPFLAPGPETVAGHVVGDRYVAVTDRGAPRRRLVAIPLDAADPDDPACWAELVPESDAVLRSVLPVGDALYLSEFHRTAARVRILRGDGTEQGVLPLPGEGALAAPFFPLTGLAATSDGSFVFAFSTLTSSWGVYRHRPGGALEMLREPAVTIDAHAELRAATAPDGTPIPYHVVRPRGASGPGPVLISAYGAAGIPTLPQYQPDLAAFVAAGGTLVQAYLRGGGEFGSAWFRAADRERRGVRDEDLLAVAEHLLAEGVAAPGRLALTGGSDGGLMCGNAITACPELWRAVLPRAPLLDLVGGFRNPYLDFVIRKAWGDPADPVDVARMIALSPYERVRPAEYPLLYVEAGANDPRCPPWQARKFVARLQAAQRGPAPILLHVYENAGHGSGTGHDVIVAQDAAWLACLLGALGLPDPDPVSVPR